MVYKLLLGFCCMQCCYAMHDSGAGENDTIIKLQASMAQLSLMTAQAKKLLAPDDPIVLEEPLSTARAIDVEREVGRREHNLYYEIQELSRIPDTKKHQEPTNEKPKKRWWRKRSKSEPHPKKNR